MVEGPHFVGVASANMDGEFCSVRLAASDGKAYSLKLTPEAVRAVIVNLQTLLPVLPATELDTLQVTRSLPLLRPDGRKAILLECQMGAIAFELPDEGMDILIGQLSQLRSLPNTLKSRN